MKCKHPLNEITWRWVNKDGTTIKFSAGCSEIKKEYTCLQCAKTFIKTPKRLITP
jgi:hypothetical protein